MLLKQNITILLLVIVTIKSQNLSPCPRLFVYEKKSTTPNRWYGLITLLSDTNLNGVWLRVVLDRPSLKLGNWFGEPVPHDTDNKEYLIKNSNFVLKANTPHIVRFFIDYDPQLPIPRLLSFRLNAIMVCPEDDDVENVTTEKLELWTSGPSNVTLTDRSDKSLFYNTNCGTIVTQPRPLITYGMETEEGEFPWHAALYYAKEIDLSYICGASLITISHTITVAHCVTRRRSVVTLPPKNLVVYLGKYYLKRFATVGIQDRHVAEIKSHPKYDPASYSNDIAIVKLEIPVEVTEYVRPVCLWSEEVDLNLIVSKQELYDRIAMALENISEWPDRDSANAANQLGSAIKTSEFVISLKVVNQAFNHSSFLSKLLQQRNIDLKKAINLAEDTELEIKNLRENADKEFRNLLSKVQEKAEKFDFSINKPRTTVTQTKRCNVNVGSAEEYYRISIYITFLDGFLINIKERFSKHKTLLTAFQELLPTDPSRLTDATITDFENLVSFYRNDVTGTLDELKVELKFWYRALSRLKEDEIPKTALAALKYRSVSSNLPKIKILLSILAVLPVSTAENERTFSVLRRLKNYIRNSSSASRLNGVTLLHLYRDMTPTPEQILDQLADKPRKLEIKL